MSGHPASLQTLVGPDAPSGAALIPRLFEAIVAADRAQVGTAQTKTTRLFREWRRLFGQAVGIPTQRLAGWIDRQARAHGAPYGDNVPAYLFALHTYISIVAKLVAALALPAPAREVADPATPLRRRLRALESGAPFAAAGITNLPGADFFSWYAEDAAWPRLAGPLEDLLNRLRHPSVAVSREAPAPGRDLFKGLYEVFVPRELRHALGEVYTPDWLAEHALDRLEWQPEDDLLDPTCGTGTFVLEALQRRLRAAARQGRTLSARAALQGLYGLDLNPLAVLAAKASLVVVLAEWLDPAQPVTLPIHLADAINVAEPTPDGFFVHRLQTEVGEKRFEVPEQVVRSPRLYEVFQRLRHLIAGQGGGDITSVRKKRTVGDSRRGRGAAGVAGAESAKPRLPGNDVPKAEGGAAGVAGASRTQPRQTQPPGRRRLRPGHTHLLPAFLSCRRTIMDGLAPLLEPLGLSSAARERFEATVAVLVDLQRRQSDGIWCPILADRFAAAAIPPVSHIAGNPPWVKWSHLPPQYAGFIKPLCQALNVLGQDSYVGGIESDIATVITFQAVRKWLAEGGRLAFYITGTLFSNESSQGFRRFEDEAGRPLAGIVAVEDFKDLSPFEGVTNHSALLLLTRGSQTAYPIPYTFWSPPTGGRAGQPFASGEEFRCLARRREVLARPVPGTDAGPWLKGSGEQHELWRTLFDASLPSPYRARKGVTTDLNGVFFVRVEAAEPGTVWVRNDPAVGRTAGLPAVRQLIEDTHVFPLLRGRGLRPFAASLDPEFHILVPQRGMHGEPDLPASAPRTHRFLARFEDRLRARGSYRRYQQGRPYWSTWSTGRYTFSPYKVLWKEMSGQRFGAAYVGPVEDPVLGRRVVVPDHKLYFVPVPTEDEARYLTGILNAATIADGVAAYAAQLSLGVSVIDNLKVPAFHPEDPDHRALAHLAGELTRQGGQGSDEQLGEMDRLARHIVSSHG
jgi:hypothetical protein